MTLQGGKSGGRPTLPLCAALPFILSYRFAVLLPNLPRHPQGSTEHCLRTTSLKDPPTTTFQTPEEEFYWACFATTYSLLSYWFTVF